MNFLQRLIRPFEKLLVRSLLNHFSYWESRGLHVTPVHFYQPVPDTRELPENLWQRRSELAGINMNEHRQLSLLDQFAANYAAEYRQFPLDRPNIAHQYFVNNGAFESVDGEILYCMIRHFKPKRIFEVGSGNSTYLAAQAVQRNVAEGHSCELVAFEPYPNEVLRAGFSGLTRLETIKAQEIALEEFQALGAGDILFIDSSHVLKIGSDVQYLYLEVLPRLRPGVFIHVHDIHLPAEYQRSWVMDRHIFWNEQYLLQAFLIANLEFEVQWAASYMHLRHPDRLEAAFSSYNRATRWPGSFWMRKVLPDK
jgi:predicted O-methyltransferase YrrM